MNPDDVKPSHERGQQNEKSLKDDSLVENQITEESNLVVTEESLTIKTMKGRVFEVMVQPTNTIMSIKKLIEDSEGKDNYPCGEQLLIHNGNILKDDEELWLERKANERGVLVLVLKEQTVENQEKELSLSTQNSESESSESESSESESSESDGEIDYEAFCTGLQFVVMDESKIGRREGYELVEEITNQPLQLQNPFNLFCRAFNTGNAADDDIDTEVTIHVVFRAARAAGCEFGRFLALGDEPPRSGLIPSRTSFNLLAETWVTFGYLAGRYVKENYRLEKNLYMQQFHDFYSLRGW
ncbi:unnamed protein product [Arabidopsis arenosa]|uniref:Ubiquitin-like domain-containing protein n=2 Tax=Arabidopsis arenosa TaxID=38785 RepID=A0A8S2B1S0_ARAAE|nr:unnamed protein product [Arabidopsis arenosa]CAE6218708.1 unnamed protein product [Arabidopsis arenosa]